MPTFRPAELLRALVRGEVEFLVVGGVAGALHGSPLNTTDLNIVFETSEANRRRLMVVLERLGAVYRDPAGRRIPPDLAKLEQMKLHLLRTELGSLDLLREIGDGWRYGELVARAVPFELDEMSIQVLDLATLIEAKAIADRPKDRAALPHLRELLSLQQKRTEELPCRGTEAD